ncbi:hypothetical protein K501DRAFT_257181 [Backusella circina FSU 941]|nr:hypothetical protein K501DRAFT_257181 [Backusella circina FSU 941]
MPHYCCSSRALGADFCSSNAVNQYAPSKVIEPIHLDINLTFPDLLDKSFDGQVTITFKHTGKALVTNAKDLSTITLNGESFEDLKVTGSDFRYDGHHIFLEWSTPFTINEERKVTIDYKVIDPIAGLYFQKPDAIHGIDSRYCITDHETEKARYWLPTVDFPTVRTTLKWSITAPEQYTSLANGTLINEKIENGLKTTEWELTYLCPSYLICFAIGDLISVDDTTVDGIPIKYYTAKGFKPDDLKRAFDATPKMIEWLQKRVGVKFPWTKYYQIALPPIRGAMENISLVTWIDIFVQDETNALEFKQITDEVNIHEMAHTYFGDLLVIRHFEHAWLKESWATYMQACWLEDHASQDEYRLEMFENGRAYQSECKSYMRPIVTRKYDSSWNMFDRHTYPGGACRIHMLRQILGEEAFWTGVTSYVEKFSGKTVQTTDFQTALEESSGLNLTRFFDEFIYSKGYPQVKGQYEFKDDRVKLSMTQTQVNAEKQIPLFAFDLEIEIIDDKNQVYNTTITFDREANATAFIPLDKGSKPVSVRVDPEGKVPLYTLDMSVDRQILMEVAKNGKDIVNRIWAYSELIKDGSRPALKAVQDNLKNEPFYGVRVHAARALASLNSTFSIEILAQVLDNEQHPHAIFQIADSCGIRDDRLRASLKSLLARKDLPYRAQARALVSLAKQRNPDDIDYLLETAKDDSKVGQHALVRAGALKALGYHRSEEGFNYLLSHVGLNIEPIRARSHAIEGLAYSAAWQSDLLKKKAIEEISTLVRDPTQYVRTGAVEALTRLEVSEASNSVANTRWMYSHDDHAWLNKKLNQFKSLGKPSEDKSTKDLIEKLEERIKKLESQVNDLTPKEEK